MNKIFIIKIIKIFYIFFENKLLLRFGGYRNSNSIDLYPFHSGSNRA